MITKKGVVYLRDEQIRQDFQRYCQAHPELSKVKKCSKCGKKKLTHEFCNASFGHTYSICEDCAVEWENFHGLWNPEDFEDWVTHIEGEKVQFT